MLVVGTNLEDLLVDSGCLGMKPVAHEIVRETHELLDRPVFPAGEFASVAAVRK